MKRSIRLILRWSIIISTLGLHVSLHAQPEFIGVVPTGSTNFVAVGNLVYFISGDALMRTDGTADGTIILQDGLDHPGRFREYKGILIFANGEDPTQYQDRWKELWRSDGTPAGTYILKASSEYDIGVVGETDRFLFFGASDVASGHELYKTDGTASGTMLVKDISPGVADGFIGFSAPVGDFLFFAGNNGVNGVELWKSDGTSAGTAMVKDINPGTVDGFATSGPGGFGYYLDGHVFVHDDRFYFTGNTATHGMEPWISDGTAGGTTLLHDVVTGSGSPYGVRFEIANEGVIYFVAYVTGLYDPEAHLWKTGGTSATTAFVKNLEDVGPEGIRSLIYHGKVYFFTWPAGLQSVLWVTDGTGEGTQSLFGTYTHEGGLWFAEVVNDYILFYGNNQNYMTPFYRSDGTSAGTHKFAGFNCTGMGVYPKTVTKVNDLVFYGDHDGPGYEGVPKDPADYFQLMQTDGVTVKSIREMFGGTYLGTDNIVNFNGKVLFTTYDDQEGTDEPKKLWIYDPSEPVGNAAYFTLINADTDEDMKRINEGDVIVKPENTNINIRYNPGETPGSVVFKLNDATARTETAPPYSLGGDINGDYAPWQAGTGPYKLTAIPYSEPGGKGTPGESLTINFTIQAETGTGECLASGTILREYWDGISGNNVSAIPTDSEPTSTNQLTIFEGPANFDTNYGTRIRGYICPPATGNYTFWIASNDNSELWLSTDDNPGNKRKIAAITGATNPREWTKYASQKSSSIALTVGKKYYIEALHKQGAGSDHIAVGWQLPDGTMERPIPGSRLSPFSGGSGGNNAPMVAITSPDEGQIFSEPATITIEADASDTDGSIIKVEFYNGPDKLGEDLTSPYDFTWADVSMGTYSLIAKATDDAGTMAASSPISVTVSGGGGACLASGSISREYWGGVQGNRVSDIPLNTAPSIEDELHMLEGPVNYGTNYGTRIRGYICPPVTGTYHFYISSNDHSELWLSTSGDDPSDRQLIAYLTAATQFRQWGRFASQKSAAITLTAGRRYYIEVLHKQGAGTDHISVAWQLPDRSMEAPIPGSRLSPIVQDGGITARSTDNSSLLQTVDPYAGINIYPNPAQSGDPELSISGYEGIDRTVETTVEIVNMTGEVLYADRILCGGNCSTYLMKINQALAPGVYLVNLKANGTRLSRRLVVR